MTMMKFFGFRFIVSNEQGESELEITDYTKFESQIKYITLDRLPNDEYKERFANLLQKSHNYSRITRILKYFNVIGLSKLSRIIINKLKDEIEGDEGGLKNNDKIQRSLTKFWENVL